MWLPIADSGSYLALDCSNASAGPAPVHHVDWERGDLSWLGPVSPSLASLVAVFVQALASGRWSYDAAGRRGSVDRSLRPEVNGLLADII